MNRLSFTLSGLFYGMFSVNIPIDLIKKVIDDFSAEGLYPIWKDTIKIKSHFIILKKHMFYPTYLLARVYYVINLGIRKCSFIGNKDGRRYLRPLFSKV